MPFEGIYRRPFLGVDWTGAALFVLKGDKIADLWVLGDVEGLREQLRRNAEH